MWYTLGIQVPVKNFQRILGPIRLDYMPMSAMQYELTYSRFSACCTGAQTAKMAINHSFNE